MRARQLSGLAIIFAVLGAATCSAQTAGRSGATRATATKATMSVDGFSGEIPIVQVNGRSYMDIEEFSRIVNASVRLQGSHLALTLPAAGSTAAAGAASPAAQAAPQPASAADASAAGFSRDFVSAAVLALGAIREWRALLLNAVRNNLPINDDLTASNRRNAEAQVALATAAARNAQDRSAAALMQNELGNMRTLNGNFVSTHDSITNIRTDAMDTDPLSVKVLNCMSALNGITVGGQFQDITSCH